MASDNIQLLLTQFLNDGRAIVSRTLQDSRIISVRATARELWMEILRIARQANELSIKLADPNLFKEHLRIIFRDKIIRNNLCYVLLGLSIGTSCGYMIGAWVARPYYPSPVMKAVACYTFDESDTVNPTIVRVPALCSPTDLLIRVRASSIHRIDNRIASGYGRTLRRMIQNYNTYDHLELPLIVGRACAGVVEGVGRSSVSGLEIGDEVWLASPWYEAGVTSQLVVAPETRVTRKPMIIGFEGAASLPYSGCIALGALEKAGLDEITSKVEKRVLVVDGCSPVGCVLTQLLKRWGAFITATCSVRSVPVIKALGADDVIAFNNDDTIYEMEERDLFVKELLIRQPYDVVFLTSPSTYNRDFISKFLTNNGQIIDTVEKRLASDDYGIAKRYLFSVYVKMKKLIAYVFHAKNDWGEAHICHKTLDRLANFVNEGILQTVVDQVYTPDDAEKAIAHICSAEAIGGTIITFRS